MSKAIEEAKDGLRTHLAALERECEQVRAALASLEPARQPRQPRQRQSSGRAKKGERQAQFKATLKKNPDYRLSEIADSMGISGNNASSLAKQLVDSGEIKKVGRGRYQHT